MISLLYSKCIKLDKVPGWMLSTSTGGYWCQTYTSESVLKLQKMKQGVDKLFGSLMHEIQSDIDGGGQVGGAWGVGDVHT